MVSKTRKLQVLVPAALIALVLGYLQVSGLLNVVGLFNSTPLPAFAERAYMMLGAAIAAHGIWVYMAASLLKGLLLLIIIPAETVTPLYVLHAADTPLDVVWISAVGAAMITLGNFAVYLAARRAGGRFAEGRDSRRWRFVELVVVEHGSISMYVLRIIPGLGGIAAIPAGIARLDIRTFLVFSFLGFLTYEAILGFIAYYGLKGIVASVPVISTLPG